MATAPQSRSTRERKPAASVVGPRDAARRHAAAFVQTVAAQVALFTPALPPAVGTAAGEVPGQA
ncbi:MAG TPA: hypothetical protein VLH10_18175 [Yinghuangia sp.]|uniref:hypothetical protein n=1 Tax=Yinghuangia sp. YIM S10712 TaxID=3436930 RepID=UPI002B8C8658|nr:hypothetical protein [Yinghuangia sp.]